MKTIKAAVSGSFHRCMGSVQSVVDELTYLNVQVLSPSDPTVVDAFGDFLFVASDRQRTIRTVQDRHLAAIRESDFLWIAIEDGYIGNSTAMEIGLAIALGKPIYATDVPLDLTFRKYIEIVPSVKALIEGWKRDIEPKSHVSNMLIDPLTVSLAIHRDVDSMVANLCTLHPSDENFTSRAAGRIRRALAGIS